MDKDLIYKLWLAKHFELGARNIFRLLKFFRKERNLYFASKDELTKSNILKESDISLICSGKNDIFSEHSLNIELQKMQGLGINMVTFDDEQYPNRLRSIYNQPYAIFYTGTLPRAELPSVAVIGARACSSYGSSSARQLVRELVRYNIQIISGMAAGIDSTAQRAALESGGYTAAVVGTGVDICYPKSQYALYEQLKTGGCIISEYPMGIGGSSWHFPMRNRIISGLADLLIVIEAREKSGTLITVDRALEQGKDVFALPGRINDPVSGGCNSLIKQGCFMLTSAQDITEYFYNNSNDAVHMAKKGSEANFKNSIIGLESDEKLVYSIISFDEIDIDSIVRRSALSAVRVGSICTKLELKDMIREVGKGRFIRIQ